MADNFLKFKPPVTHGHKNTLQCEIRGKAVREAGMEKWTDTYDEDAEWVYLGDLAESAIYVEILIKRDYLRGFFNLSHPNETGICQ